MEDAPDGAEALSPALQAFLEAQKNSILTAVNSEIQGLQNNILMEYYIDLIFFLDNHLSSS